MFYFQLDFSDDFILFIENYNFYVFVSLLKLSAFIIIAFDKYRAEYIRFIDYRFDIRYNQVSM